MVELVVTLSWAGAGADEEVQAQLLEEREHGLAVVELAQRQWVLEKAAPVPPCLVVRVRLQGAGVEPVSTASEGSL